MGKKFNDVMCLCCFSFFSLQNPYSFPFFGRGGGGSGLSAVNKE